MEAEQIPLDSRNEELRTVLVDSYGEPTRWRMDADGQPADDPLFAELRHLNAESDARTGRMLALTNVAKKMPATTLAGLLAKVSVALSLFPE